MFLKDHLKDIYQKASFDSNQLLLDHVINKWAHRFGVGSLNELIVKNQDQINLLEEAQSEENYNQINLESLKNVQHEEDIETTTNESGKPNNNQIINKDTYLAYKKKRENKNTEELPLPNINNLRKWIKKEKKVS